MNKYFFLLSAACVMSYQSFAQAPWSKNHKPQQYFRIESGFMVKNQVAENEDTKKYKTNNNTFGGVALGWQFSKNLKAEFNALYTPTTKTKINKSGNSVELISSHIAGFANLFLTADNFEFATPYVFVGIGVSRNRLSTVKDLNANGEVINTQRRSGNTHLAWNVGGGLSFDLRNNYYLDLGYRFIDYGVIKSSLRGTYGPASANAGVTHSDTTYNYNFSKVKSYQITVALRYMFKN